MSTFLKDISGETDDTDTVFFPYRPTILLYAREGAIYSLVQEMR